MEAEVYENNFEECEFCKVVYYEHDTGYKEYGCSLITGNANDCYCVGGDIDSGCPLSFKYITERFSQMLENGGIDE